jgi:hypothetical protein
MTVHVPRVNKVAAAVVGVVVLMALVLGSVLLVNSQNNHSASVKAAASASAAAKSADKANAAKLAQAKIDAAAKVKAAQVAAAAKLAQAKIDAAAKVAAAKAAVPPAPAVVVVPVAPVYAPSGVTDPWAVVSEYYGLIESGDYIDAWNLGSQSFMNQNGDNFPAFEAGFANTGAQTLTEISEYGDTVSFDLSAVDTATGVTQYFTGTYTVDGGLITSGTISQTG